MSAEPIHPRNAAIRIRNMQANPMGDTGDNHVAADDLLLGVIKFMYQRRNLDIVEARDIVELEDAYEALDKWYE